MKRKKFKFKGKREKSKHTNTVREPDTIPPLTRRYCIHCGCNRVFRYDPGPGHSLCVACGGYKARKSE